MSAEEDVEEDTFIEEKNLVFSLGTQLAKKIPHQPKKYKCSLKQHNKREDAITTYYCLCVTYTKGTSVLLTSMNAHFFRSLIFRTFLPYV